MTSVFVLSLALILPTQAPAVDTITVDDLKADLFFLAGDSFKGRLTGTPENDLACEFVASRFQRMGLKPIGAGGYYHSYYLATATMGARNALTLHLPQSKHVFQVGADFIPARVSSSGTAVSQNLAFVGFGIVDKARGHVDYKDGDLRGSIAVMLNHEPGEGNPKSPFDGLVASEASTPWRKVLDAQRAGALAVVFVNDIHNHGGVENFADVAASTWPKEKRRLETYTLKDWLDGIRIPVVSVSTPTARTILGLSDAEFDKLIASSESPTLRRIELEKSLEITASVNRGSLRDRNVIAAIPGTDPKLKDEWIVVSSHIDHDGADGTHIYNGADDNGSGTVGLLEIAEAFVEAARQGHSPRRSVLFAAFNSEERGLLGSWAFVENPPIPRDKIVANLNMDMIGRNEEVPENGGRRFAGLPIQTAESNKNAVNVMGYTKTASLAKRVEEANAGIGLLLKRTLDSSPSNLLRRSDQWPFLHHGIPAVFFHTGLHPDYHTPNDRPERINYPKMERITRLVYQTAWNLSQSESRPTMDAPKQ